MSNSASQNTSSGAGNVQSTLQEHRHFPPSAEFSKRANVKSMAQYEKMYKESIENPEKFWGEAAGELHWFKKWDKVVEWNLPDVKWFVGGKTNISYNCLDRQIAAGLGDKVAILWEGEPMPGGKPEVRKITYKELHKEVCQFANVLKGLGVKKGDIVTLYLPMIPELAVAMLACARIGAPHSIIFGGFSAAAIRDRVEDAKSKVIVTSDGGWRRGKEVQLKFAVDQAVNQQEEKLQHLVDHVVVVKRTGGKVEMDAKRDHWYHELMAKASPECPAEPMDAEDLLFVLYTSGSTGKPKGIMHTTGGYMVYTYLTNKYTFDMHGNDQPGFENDVHWCTADIGWVTGHSYVVYGVLPNKTTSLMYEGAPDAPEKNRFWDIIERHKVTIFYTAPTAIRAFMKWGSEHVTKHNLSSIRLLGSVGEPINPEAWMWYHEYIGGKKTPIVDTWWQTETGGHMITPMPGATSTIPGSATRPFFGIDVAIVDKNGKEVPDNQGGFLVIRKPWPSMLRGIIGDRERFVKTYFGEIPGVYFAGDGARKDLEGNFWIMGRVDDVINVSGHRLGTMEVESALVSHPAIAEAAVVGMPHEIKGTGIAAFVTLRTGFKADDTLKESIGKHVTKEIGAIARPDQIRFSDGLPKTRSGKIMRRLLRELASGNEIKGDMTSLEDFQSLAKLRDSED